MLKFNTNRLLQWRLILEENKPQIEHIPGYKNIVADALSRLPINRSQKTTDESTYTTENMSELYDIEELPEGTFSLSLNLIDRFRREDPFPTENIKCA